MPCPKDVPVPPCGDRNDPPAKCRWYSMKTGKCYYNGPVKAQ